MSGFESDAHGEEIAKTIYEMCWHFVGPHLVSMGKREANEILGFVDALNSLFFFTCSIGHREKIVRAIVSSAEQLFQIGLWYSNRETVNKVIEGYEEARDACYSDKRQLEFKVGLQSIYASINRIRRHLLKTKPQWSSELRRLEKIVTA